MTKATAYLDYDRAVEESANKCGTIPHCDSRILHHPDECEYCADRPELQQRRRQLKIAFTGHEPKADEIPCEADLERGPGSQADHRRWGGNKPTSALVNPEGWPEESFSSRMLYGEPEDRVPFKPTKEEKAFAPWYMKVTCRNDEGTTIGCDYRWWAKPFRRWL